MRGERLTTPFDRRGGKAMPYSGSENGDGRCIPSLLAPSALAEDGGLAPCTAQAKVEALKPVINYVTTVDERRWGLELQGWGVGIQ